MISAEWLAGFVDGEGCITVYRGEAKGTRKSSHFSPVVSITNTHLPTLLRIQIDFGGRLYSGKTPKNKPWNQRWSLVWAGRGKVRGLLEKISPFLITKREEALFMLNVWIPQLSGGKPGKKVSDIELTKREALTIQLAQFKRQNYPVQTVN